MNKWGREQWIAYLFMSPAVLLLLAFVFFPSGYAFFVSLHDWNLLGGRKFIGFGNYARLLNDTYFWRSLGRSILYASIVVPLVFVFSFGLALLVRHIGKSSNFFRTVFFFPNLVSTVISVLIFRFILDSAPSGLMNYLIGFLGFEPVSWLGTTSGSWFGLINVFFWTSIGFYMLIMLSGLLDIPVDYYEAAHIDGANRWHSFWHITVPQMKNSMVFVFIVNIINAFQYFDLFLIMTKGGPARSTEITVLYIYNLGFGELRLGYASAISFLLFLLVFVLTLVQVKLFRVNKSVNQ
ncbi:sugar ABC transporter permease [Paenibacillus alba]|uniref:carbohydrate ABC transporter permease n=1 Tax=Paenibacillus alba TaxID=1197127 RepID=UPI001565FE62|nr:sugar ABC transporter permease [Paenibacillus alba]NQX67231.1 sugar ABC transporter permease [Paenibacillus alba]